MRRHPRVVHDAQRLPADRARARISAYVYGNILVLAAVATATPHTLANGHAALVVVATTVTTYLAHVLAFAVGASIRPDDPRQHIETSREELRDALPIMSSGSIPTFLLVLAWLSEPDLRLTQLLAAAVVIVRLGSIGTLVSLLSGEPVSRRSQLTGLAIAGISTVIVVLKVWWLH